MSIQIESYIKKPAQKVIDLQEVIMNPFKFFINITDEEDIRKIKKALDLNYLEGCLLLTYKNEVIIGFELWDFVDQLWSYFIELINNYLLFGFAESYFPDQPVKIMFKKERNNFVLFSLKVDALKTWLLPEKEFLYILLNGAEFFFSQIISLLDIPYKIYKNELEQIGKLKLTLNNNE